MSCPDFTIGTSKRPVACRAHLRGTMLTYVRHLPFQHHMLDELKALLKKLFPPRDLMTTYKAELGLVAESICT